MAMQQLLLFNCSTPEVEERKEMFICFFSSFAEAMQRKDGGYLSVSCSWGKGKEDTTEIELSLPILFSIDLFMHPSCDGTDKEQQ